MNIQSALQEKLKLFEQVKNHLGEIQTKMGALQEEQRSVYNKGLEIKGAIDTLLAIQAEEAKALKGSKTASLILPEGVKPVVEVVPNSAPQESSVQAQVPGLPVLEVK